MFRRLEPFHARERRAPTRVGVSRAVPGREHVVVATTPEAVEALRAVWATVPITDIDSDIDYFLTVVREATQVIRPHVVYLRTEDGRHLIAVARLENLPLPFRLGYRTLGSATLRAIVVTFGGFLGARSQLDETRMMSSLCGSLWNGEADALLMRNVAQDRTLKDVAMNAVPSACRTRGLPTSPRWIAAVPDKLDGFLQVRSTKTRKRFRREGRAIEETPGFELCRFREVGELERLCRDMETVAARAYQRGLGVGFGGSRMERALMAVGMARGWYRAWVLYLHARPVAFWTGFAYGETFFVGTPGFDPEHAALSVGNYTMLRMAEDLCADEAIRFLDFGHGDADYKAAYGHADRIESDVLLSAPRLKPMAVMLALSALSVVNRLGRRLVERSVFVRRLKNRWRRGMANAG